MRKLQALQATFSTLVNPSQKQKKHETSVVLLFVSLFTTTKKSKQQRLEVRCSQWPPHTMINPGLISHESSGSSYMISILVSNKSHLAELRTFRPFFFPSCIDTCTNSCPCMSLLLPPFIYAYWIQPHRRRYLLMSCMRARHFLNPVRLKQYLKPLHCETRASF